MPVHDVDMQRAAAGLFERGHLLAQTGEVGGKEWMGEFRT